MFNKIIITSYLCVKRIQNLIIFNLKTEVSFVGRRTFLE